MIRLYTWTEGDIVYEILEEEGDGARHLFSELIYPNSVRVEHEHARWEYKDRAYADLVEEILQLAPGGQSGPGYRGNGPGSPDLRVALVQAGSILEALNASVQYELADALDRICPEETTEPRREEGRKV
jgi:hypothetical protein